MTGVVLVHGAWHDGSCWDLVVRELEGLGHPTVAVDLPCEEPGFGAVAYAEVVEAAIGRVPAGPVVLVGHSLGGLTVPVVARRLEARRLEAQRLEAQRLEAQSLEVQSLEARRAGAPPPGARPSGPGRVGALVLVCALLPQPGSSFDDQVRADPGVMAAGFGAGQLRHDDRTTSWPVAEAEVGLYRGVAEELAAAQAVAPGGRPGVEVASVVRRLRRQAWTIGREPTPLEVWPAVPTTVVVGAQDRVVAPDRLRARATAIPGAVLVELPGGHFPMLTRPAALAAVIAAAAAGG